MKIVELRRHSKKTTHGNANLSEDGLLFARYVGARQLRGRKFTHLFVSSLQRTVDTIRAFAESAEDFPSIEPSVFLDVFSTTDAIQLWEGVCNEAERNGEDMMTAAIERDTERAERIATLGAEAFRRWTDVLPDGANALVVHHSPSIELLVYGLFGVVLPQLQPCDGLRITVRDTLQLTTPIDDSTLHANTTPHVP